MNRHHLTKAGADRLREELSQLKKVDRPRIIAAITSAIRHIAIGQRRFVTKIGASKVESNFRIPTCIERITTGIPYWSKMVKVVTD